LSLERTIETEVVKFVRNGIKNIEELTGKAMIQEASINPFLVKALGISDFDALARFYVFQRIGRSLVTSFGMTVMESFVKTLGGGKKGQWWDINISKDGKHLHISVKSGPRDMDADQVTHFAREAQTLMSKDESAVPLIAMCYGREPLGPIVLLPRLVIDLFATSNGGVIKVGDASHPNAVEVVCCYPDWAERNERMLEEIRKMMDDVSYEKDYLKRLEYLV
jgi:hypothetical protein